MNSSQIEKFAPLVPVAETPETVQPTIDIPEERRIPLSELGTKRAKGSPGTIKNHIRGICGEYAVAKFFGIPERLNQEIYEYGDEGFDLKIAGRTIDVKTVGPYTNNPCLMVGEDQALNADYYVLVQELNANTYRIIGYAPSVMVNEAPIQRISLEGYAERVRTVEQQDLFHLPQSAASIARPNK